MRRISLSFISLLLLTPSLVRADSQETRVLSVNGPVYLHLAGTTESNFKRVLPGSSLEEGDQIVTGAAGSTQLMLQSGSLIDINPGSDFTIEKNQKESAVFFLRAGTILGKIRSLLETKQQMSFRTPVAVAAVRGTELAVSHDADEDKSAVGVFDEGEVAVQEAETKDSASESVTLTPGMETEIKHGLPPLEPRKMESFQKLRERMKMVREERDFAWKNFRERTNLQREKWRERLRRQPVVPKEFTPAVRPLPGRDRPMNRPAPQQPAAPRPSDRRRP